MDEALNYDSAANILENCVFPVSGCTDSTAANYNGASNTEDGMCVYY